MSNLDLNQTAYFDLFKNKMKKASFNQPVPNLWLGFGQNQAYYDSQGTIVLLVKLDSLIWDDSTIDTMLYHEMGHFLSQIKGATFDTKRSEEGFADWVASSMVGVEVFCDVLIKTNPIMDESHDSPSDRCEAQKNVSQSIVDFIEKM